VVNLEVAQHHLLGCINGGNTVVDAAMQPLTD